MEKLIACKTGYKRRAPRTGKGHQPQDRLVKAEVESGTVPGGRSFSLGYKTSDWDQLPACQIGTDQTVDTRPEFKGKTTLRKGAGFQKILDKEVARQIQAAWDARDKRQGYI